jgi:acetyl-CoA carboxylase biotin carboxylase subunit
MGDKITAKRTAKELGLPLVPGSDGACRRLPTAKKSWPGRSAIRCIIKAAPAAAGAA